MRAMAAATLLTIAVVRAAAAQGVDGHVSLTADVFPHVTTPDGADQRRTAELRARILIERRFDLSDRVRFTAAGFADGLVADRVPGETTTAAIVRPQELHVEAIWAHADLRVGMSRVVWGRLDEFQPTDVVNPLDLTRFFFEGRTEARMPVAMIRGRWLPSDRFALEGLYVPFWRRGSFDQLDELSSPFNLAPPSALIEASDRPARALDRAQGGVRASLTTGRVDWSIAAYRGYEPLPLFELGAQALVERYPRFTMIGGDFETVRGAWGVRGEVAAFVDRALQPASAPVILQGRTLDAGIGVDRRAGAYRVSGKVLIARRWPAAGSQAIDRSDVTLVTAIDRSFARETRTLRLFAVYNPGERSAFARAVASFALRDNLALEMSAGWFTGDGRDALSLLETRDFLYTRLKVFF